jgi:hypothetical protein
MDCNRLRRPVTYHIRQEDEAVELDLPGPVGKHHAQEYIGAQVHRQHEVHEQSPRQPRVEARRALLVAAQTHIVCILDFSYIKININIVRIP